MVGVEGRVLLVLGEVYAYDRGMNRSAISLLQVCLPACMHACVSVGLQDWDVRIGIAVRCNQGSEQSGPTRHRPSPTHLPTASTQSTDVRLSVSIRHYLSSRLHTLSRHPAPPRLPRIAPAAWLGA